MINLEDLKTELNQMEATKPPKPFTYSDAIWICRTHRGYERAPRLMEQPLTFRPAYIETPVGRLKNFTSQGLLYKFKNEDSFIKTVEFLAKQNGWTVSY